MLWDIHRDSPRGPGGMPHDLRTSLMTLGVKPNVPGTRHALLNPPLPGHYALKRSPSSRGPQHPRNRQKVRIGLEKRRRG